MTPAISGTVVLGTLSPQMNTTSETKRKWQHLRFLPTHETDHLCPLNECLNHLKHNFDSHVYICIANQRLNSVR